MIYNLKSKRIEKRMPGSHSSDDGYAKNPVTEGSRLLADCDNDDRLGFVQKVYGILAT